MNKLFLTFGEAKHLLFFLIFSSKHVRFEYIIISVTYLIQGLMQHHEQIAEYFRIHGVSLIFLFRRNLLRRMVSVLANEYDKNAKLLNGTHKSHVHSPKEVSIFFFVHVYLFEFECSWLNLCINASIWFKMFKLVNVLQKQLKAIHVTWFWLHFQAEVLAKYKPIINSTLLIAQLRQVNDTTTKALEYFKSTRHIILYYEDVVKNRTVSHSTWCMMSATTCLYVCKRGVDIWIVSLVSRN